ncbi:hypothetical protein ZMO1_ZMOp33x007 (plasmid) [Zymomonas mobilis subsp. mobilis ZM4 = ATCC 31821]|nr:hypothetical protein ZMO2_ZMOp33x007 [Zymomonas mobilis subsp. mobilis]AVZ28711.1 hypothetical protein ZMO3_ZMOp33x007 [Zymomonas mobilis subsp. mobilis]AVZ43157.1 hypothetical protein ZMO1_ZMOp33x007 [Zymomonas mobilis subsp. mobilis ZM4 = ATCC 31821]
MNNTMNVIEVVSQIGYSNISHFLKGSLVYLPLNYWILLTKSVDELICNLSSRIKIN